MPSNPDTPLRLSSSNSTGYNLPHNHNSSNSLNTKTMLKSENISHSSVKEIRSPSLAITSTSLCSKCSSPILNVREGGQYVTIPGVDENDVPHIYHPECFKCAVCDKPFNDTKKGSTSFVRNDLGPCHIQVGLCPPRFYHL